MSRRLEHPLFRATALVAALSVLLLVVFGASPTLHVGLHDHETADHCEPVSSADHVCAVTLFASGVTALLAFCLLMLGRLLTAGGIVRLADEIVVALPRYRLVPSHAPPAA